MNRFSRHRVPSAISLTTTEYEGRKPCTILTAVAVYYDIYRVEPCRRTQVIVLAYHEVGTKRRSGVRRRTSPDGKAALFAGAVAGLYGVPMHKQPRC